MRVDVVSIFPEYLAPLRLSLVGRAITEGRLELHVHDLREWTRDRHRTVDDAPYGGGPGMVMRPEPWGECLDELLGDSTGTGAPASPVPGQTVLVVPTPAGIPFRQPVAADLAGVDRLIFACGRYEGIDQRVIEHYAARLPVLELSIGDYVLAGGEAAVLVVVEAVARLLPGVLGNTESALHDSFSDSHAGLLEAPVYTRPPQWRGLAVPPVLVSGDHGAVDRWRAEQSEERTARIRPDLLPRS